MTGPPNVLYLHSHDTGRYIQPYGHPVPTPNLQRLADQGILFRQAFATAATCSGSRAGLITGQYPHRNGMMGSRTAAGRCTTTATTCCTPCASATTTRS